jgi:CDP-glycerol glycerophosphotransferase
VFYQLKKTIRANTSFYTALLKCGKAARMILCNVIIMFCGIENKAVFQSFNGKQYSCNPRAISEELHRRQPDMKIVWLFRNPEEKKKIAPDYVHCLKIGTFKALYENLTAKFWVDNFEKPLDTIKRKEQVYIQTYHSDRCFKKKLYDSPFITKNTKFIESEICDLAISGSDFADKLFKTAFHYTGEIQKYGCPRNDILVRNDSEKAGAIKKQLNIEENTKILLYAPTMRREASNKYALQPLGEIDLIATIKALEEKTAKEWVCLVRAHSAVKGLSGIPSDLVKIIDVTTYEDMCDMLLISDFLITDYSSSAGDFALLGRPIILFQADRDDYIKHDRTFYFDMDKSPYKIVQDQHGLVKMIENMDWDIIPQNCKEILSFFGTTETGRASEKVVEYMLAKQKQIS